MSIFENTDQFTLKLYLLSATSLLRYFRYYCESKKLKRHLHQKEGKSKVCFFQKSFQVNLLCLCLVFFYIHHIPTPTCI